MVLKKSEKIFLPAKVGNTVQLCEYRIVNHMKGNRYLLKAVSYCANPRFRTLKKASGSKSTLKQSA